MSMVKTVFSSTHTLQWARTMKWSQIPYRIIKTWKQYMQIFLSSNSYLHQHDIKSRYSGEPTQFRVTSTLDTVIIVSSGNISNDNHTLATLTKHIILSFCCNPSSGLFFCLLIDFYLDTISPKFTFESLWAYQGPSHILKGVDIVVIKNNNCTLTALTFLPQGNWSANPDLVKLAHCSPLLDWS